MDKPVWFLDVDGVVNVIPSHKRDHLRKSWSEWETAKVAGYPILWSPLLVEAINSIHRSGKADVRWLTTWKSEAPEKLAPVIGLDDFPVAAAAPGSEDPYRMSYLPENSRWWKLNTVVRHMDDHSTAVIWTDDDIMARYSGKFIKNYAASRELPFLKITPYEHHGLTPKHIQEIRGFVGLD